MCRNVHGFFFPLLPHIDVCVWWYSNLDVRRFWACVVRGKKHASCSLRTVNSRNQSKCIFSFLFLLASNKVSMKGIEFSKHELFLIPFYANAFDAIVHGFPFLCLLFLQCTIKIRITKKKRERAQKKRKKKLRRTSCLHGITKNVAIHYVHIGFHNFRSVRFHTPFSSTFCWFFFLLLILGICFVLSLFFALSLFPSNVLLCIGEFPRRFFGSSADFCLKDEYQWFLRKKINDNNNNRMWPSNMWFTCTKQMAGVHFRLFVCVEMAVVEFCQFNCAINKWIEFNLNEACAFFGTLYFRFATPSFRFSGLLNANLSWEIRRFHRNLNVIFGCVQWNGKQKKMLSTEQYE